MPGWAPQLDGCVCVSVCLCLSCTPHPSLVSPCWRWEASVDPREMELGRGMGKPAAGLPAAVLPDPSG